MKIKFWILLTVSVLAIITYFCFNRWNKIHVDNGRNNNTVRIRLHVPIIEDNMIQVYAPDSFLANHWKTIDDSPTDDKPLHYLKNITPIGPLNKVIEKDSFRKRLDSKRFSTFYIKSAIVDNTHAIREGLLTIENSNGSKNIKLNEERIDSVATSWGLDYLSRDKINVSGIK